MGLIDLFSICHRQDARHYQISKEAVIGRTASLSSKVTVSKEKSPSETIKALPSQKTKCACSSPTPSAHHDALIVTSSSRYEVIKLSSPDCMEDDHVVISTRVVGLNPIDWKSVALGMCLPEFPWVIGRELAGVVDRVGKGVTSFSPGDRVWTSTYYKKREAGCFQERVKAPEHTVLPIPSNIDFKDAACLGVAGLTAAMTLWHWMEVPIQGFTSGTRSDSFVLIWGGSTITGQFAIQIAVYSGLTVIAVASEKTQTLVRRLGAQHIITRDGKTGAEILTEIRQTTGDGLTKAIDIVGPDTAAVALSALSSSKPSIIAPLSFLPRDVVIPEHVTTKNIEMKTFILNPESRKYAIELNRLVEQEKIKIPSIEVLEGGLQVIPRGLERLRKGDMEGKKLVVPIS